VDVVAVLDSAEIPTAQELPALDINHDGTTSAEELSAASSARCAELAGAITARVAAQVLGWQVRGATLVTVPGAAGLPTLRLQCSLTAAADLTSPTRVSYSDSYQSDRVGWHEITVAGDGVRTINSPVPAATVSDELRSYPNDLLSSPLATLTRLPASSGGPTAPCKTWSEPGSARSSGSSLSCSRCCSAVGTRCCPGTARR